MPSKINVSKLQEGLRTKRLGRNIIFNHTASSTNDWAKELAAFQAGEGTVTIAGTQTRGRGRLGREWVSPLGGLWFSIILRPNLRPAEVTKLVFVAGLAVAETLHELYDLTVETKWPNDVMISGRKVCGILAEMNTTGEEPNSVILGIGTNANFAVENLPEPLRENATSLKTELGKDIDIEQLFRILLEKLESAYDLFMNQGFGPILERWKKFASFLGSQVEVSSGTEKWVGVASDVDNDGSLILRLEDGTTKRVFAGDVSVRSKQKGDKRGRKAKMRTFTMQYVKEVPQATLRRIWPKSFSSKPFPKVQAFILKPEPFLETLDLLTKTWHIKDDRISEYGFWVSNSKAAAFAFYADGEECLVILVRENSPFPLEKDLKHELRHVFNGEVR
jgi:BirA family biotin operon repressor/biotin-[acetyl-CoA-carboxylase] ligase